MAEIIQFLVDEEELTKEQIQERLGMEWEEVDRLYDRAGMLDRGSISDFRKGWQPVAGTGNKREDIDPTADERSTSHGGGSGRSKGQRIGSF
jgi:hypothetical protein